MRLILVAPGAMIIQDRKVAYPVLLKPGGSDRVFKTAWFAKETRKAKITDDALCRAIKQVMQGQADDLDGGVYKKRLNDNIHRSIIVAKAELDIGLCLCQKDRENIAPDALAAFKKLAKDYGSAGSARIAALLIEKELLEICDDD